MALWKLLLGVISFVVAIDLVEEADGWLVAVVGAVTFGAFTVAAWRWGRDSRDGADWKPKPQRGIDEEADPERSLLDVNLYE